MKKINTYTAEQGIVIMNLISEGIPKEQAVKSIQIKSFLNHPFHSRNRIITQFSEAHDWKLCQIQKLRNWARSDIKTHSKCPFTESELNEVWNFIQSKKHQ